MIKIKNLKTLVVGLVLMLPACIAPDPSFKAYVIAHRLSHDAQAPHYLSLVEQHVPQNTDAELATKNAIKRRVEQEARMINEAEKYLGIR